MVQGSGSDSDFVVAGLGAARNEDLGVVAEMIVLLERLRARGLSVDEVAAAMAAEFDEPPGGGVWDGLTVTNILQVVDSVRREDPDGLAPPPSEAGGTWGERWRSAADLDGDWNPDGGRGWSLRRILQHPVSLVMLVLLVLLLGLAAFRSSTNTEGTESAATPAADGPEPTQTTETGTEALDAPAGAITSDTTPAEAPVDTSIPSAEAHVEATLDLRGLPGPGLFRVTGRVPSAEIEEALVQTVDQVFVGFGQVDLEVDESLDPAPFLTTSPQLITLLPAITDGTITIEESGITLTGRASNQERVDLLTSTLEQLSGQTVSVDDMEITGLRPYDFHASAEDGRLTIGGEVASEFLRQIIVSAAVQAYGEANVVDEFTVSSEVEVILATYQLPLIIAVLANFPRYDIQVVGGSISGNLQGGASFPFDSTDISPEIAELLDLAAGIVTNDPSLSFTVKGHTDSVGSDDYNLRLSQRRAESVIEYLTAAGIDPTRLAALGAGESEPIAPNDTPEGRALNRRVEFQLEPMVP